MYSKSEFNSILEIDHFRLSQSKEELRKFTSILKISSWSKEGNAK